MKRLTYAEHVVALVMSLDPDLPLDLARIYGLLAMTRGTDTTMRDVHDAWAVWRLHTAPDHPSLVPFDELSHEVQEKDRPYMELIHEVARRLEAEAG